MSEQKTGNYSTKYRCTKSNATALTDDFSSRSTSDNFVKDPLLKLATIFIQEHLFPVKALELRETDGSGNKNTTEEISLGVGLKKEYS